MFPEPAIVPIAIGTAHLAILVIEKKHAFKQIISISAHRSFKQHIVKKAALKAAFLYPEPGSNRHILRYWCLRPTRLPIPPSGHLFGNPNLL